MATLTGNPAEDARRSPRVGVELPLKMGEAVHIAVAWNASDHGVMVFSPVGYIPGKQVLLSSNVGWSARARVVWSRLSLESAISIPRVTGSWKAVFAVGLEFGEPQPAFWRRRSK